MRQCQSKVFILGKRLKEKSKHWRKLYTEEIPISGHLISLKIRLYNVASQASAHLPGK